MKPLNSANALVRTPRRSFVRATGAFAAAALAAQAPWVRAQIGQLNQANNNTVTYLTPLENELPPWPRVRMQLGGRTPTKARVVVDMPAFAENGNSVPLLVNVDSPMSATSYVKNLTVYSERNPRPIIATFDLSPENGRAQIDTRIRLAGTQNLIAMAEMNDGSLWWGSTHVVVTISACLEG